MTPPFEPDWVDNLGLGSSVNDGAIRGRSLVLRFNQE
ncbi:Solitary outer membrane autotransporter beta-barrel domain [Vibrio rotiferianus]